MTEITEILNVLKRVKYLNDHIDEIDQEELIEVYNKEKIKDGSDFKHPFLKPTHCPYCGNYRLDFGGSVFQCPASTHKEYWDNKLRFILV
jgi:hypothetical protein